MLLCYINVVNAGKKHGTYMSLWSFRLKFSFVLFLSTYITNISANLQLHEKLYVRSVKIVGTTNP